MHDSHSPELPDTPEVPGSATVVQHDTPPPGLLEAADSAAACPAAPGAERYELLDEIARGGMGVVFRARDRSFDREVGLKTLLSVPAPGSAIPARFHAEAHITGQLQHPNIPPAHDLGTLPDGRPYLAMKLIKGRTLDALLKDRPDPAHDRGRFLAVFEKIAEGVAYAHAHKVIHRDLKPLNVMVGAFGEVQVMDWGLAKVLAGDATEPAHPGGTDTRPTTEIRPSSDGSDETRPGSVFGTPAYMPREQAIGAVDQIDARSDVFALGGILCAVLTGEPPYVGGDAESKRQRAAVAKLDDCFARLDACGAEPELVALAKRCLAAERDDRPKDAGEVAKAVAGLRAEAERRAHQAELDRATAEVQIAEHRKRRRVQLALAGAVLILAVGSGAFAWWQDQQAAARRDRFARNAERVEELLTACEAALQDDYDPEKAEVPLAEAERRAAEGGCEHLTARLARCRADTDVLRELDRINDLHWTIAEGREVDKHKIVAGWQEAFGRFGVVPGTTPPAETARLVTVSLVKDRLLNALDMWLSESQSVDLLSILREADPDPYRNAIRAATAAGQTTRVTELAGQPPALRQPPRFAAVLGRVSSVPAERQVQLLVAALSQRPNDFPLLMNLGTAEYVRGFESDSKGWTGRHEVWFRAAVAVRPKNAAAHSNLAMALEDNDDPEGAIACYKEAIRLDPKYADAHHGLGSVLYRKKDPGAAMACYKDALTADPTHAPAHHSVGDLLKAKGDLAGAAAAYTEAIRFAPRSYWHRSALANVLKTKGDADGALAVYREAIRVDPKSASAHHDLGKALRERKDLDGAIAAYNETIKLYPKYSSARNDLGLALQAKGDLDGAVAAYRGAIGADPRYASPHNNLGLALQAKGDLDGAVAAYREAIRIDPKYATAHNNLGLALRAKGDLDGAVAAYREAVRRNPKYVAAHINLGNALRDVKDIGGVIAAYRRAIEADPKSAIAHNNLGLALSDRKDLDGAIAAYREAIKHDPRYASAHNNLGLALRARGNAAGAIAAFREAVKLNPEHLLAHSNLGAALRAKGDLDGAITEYREVTRLDPKSAFGYQNLGSALEARGDLDGAAAAYREVIRLDPKFALARHSLAGMSFGRGNALRAKGDLDGAIAAYREAAQADPTHALVRMVLAFALRDKGDLDGAVAALTEAIEIQPQNSASRTLLRQFERWRELLPRLPDMAAGKTEPKTPAEAVEFAHLCGQPFQKRYVSAALLYGKAFTADPRLADDLEGYHRYNASRYAALAAAGRDGATALGVEEWGQLTDAAHRWLRADLVAWAAQAKYPKLWPGVREALTRWTTNPELAAVRDPAWLAAMPEADRKRWGAFWTEVGALIALVSPAIAPPPREK